MRILTSIVALVIAAVAVRAEPIVGVDLLGAHAAAVAVPDTLPVSADLARYVYEWQQLNPPRVYNGEIQFRGTPAAYTDGEIDAHARSAADRIAQSIPADFAGIVVLDQETMAWDFETCERWAKPAYDLTMRLIRDKHYPGEDLGDPAVERKVRATARSVYNQRALRLTLGYVREVRKRTPNARIGYYAASAYGIDADIALAVFREVDVILPCLYASMGETEKDIDRTMARARAAASIGGDKPIWAVVSPAIDGNKDLLPDDAIRRQFVAPMELGAVGVLWWQDVTTAEQAAATNAAMSEGGALLAAIEEVEARWNPSMRTPEDRLADLRQQEQSLRGAAEAAAGDWRTVREQIAEIERLCAERMNLAPHAGVDARLSEIDAALRSLGVVFEEQSNATLRDGD